MSRKKAKSGARGREKAVGGAGGRDVYLETHEALRWFFGVGSKTTIKNWIGEGAPPKVAGRGYDLKAWFDWHQKRSGSGRTDEDDRRIKRFRADLMETQAAAARGKFIDAKEAKRACDRIVDTFVAIVERAPGELAGKLSGKKAENRRIVERWATEARKALVGGNVKKSKRQDVNDVAT